MCGPIALALPIRNQSVLVKILLVLSYNLGRVFTYSVFGLLFGAVGKGLFIAGYQQILSITLGLLLLAGVLLPATLTRKNKLNAGIFHFFNSIKNRLGILFRSSNKSSMFLIGLLNGLLPCGLVYMAVAGSVASGDPQRGALFMAAFGIGTAPLMLLLPYVGQYVSASFRSGIRKAVPVFVSALALLLVLRGLNLGIPYISPKLNSEKNEVVCCHPVTPHKVCCYKPQH
jgi:sulfite exporter TauE/SafE